MSRIPCFKICAAAALSVSVLLLAEQPRATQVIATWLGGVGNWNNPALWSSGVVPNNTGATTYDVRIDGGNPIVSNVSLNMSATVDRLTLDVGDSLRILGGCSLEIAGQWGAGQIDNAGSIQLLSTGSPTQLYGSGGDVSLTGGGIIVMGDQNNNRLYQSGSGTLTNVDNTIRGGGQIGINMLPIINQGTIIADQPTALTLDPGGTITNSGTLRAQSGATLKLFNGTFSNISGVIEALDGSVVEIGSATIIGGTLQTIGTGEFRSLNATLDGTGDPVVSSGLLSVPSVYNLTVKGTLHNTGTIRLNSTGSLTDLVCTGGDVSLMGGGTIVMGDQHSNRLYQTGSGTLTNVDNTIRGGGQIGANALPIINQSTIIADQPTALTLDPGGTITNSGTLRAQSGATLKLFNGTFSNISGVIEALDGSVVEIGSATIIGGTLQTIGTGEFRSLNATLDGTGDPVVSSGLLSVPSGYNLTVMGTVRNAGTIRLNSTGSLTDLVCTGGDVSLTGGGTIMMGDQNNNRLYQTGSGTLTNVDNTIRGAGQLGVNTRPIVNRGAIRADSNTALLLDPDGIVGVRNEGMLEVTGAGGLTIAAGPFVTSGVVSIDVGRSLTRSGAYDQIAGVTTVNGTLSAGSINLQGGTLAGTGAVSGPVTSSGTVSPGASVGTLSVAGAYQQTASGILDVQLAGLTPGTEYDRLIVSGSATLGGTLRVQIVEPFLPQVGDSFVVLLCASRTGTFMIHDADCLHPAGKRFRVTYGPSSVTVTVMAASMDLADMDCDCVLSPDDFSAFALALVNPAAYASAHPSCSILRGDMNGDGLVNGDDLQGFVSAVTTP